MSESDYNGKVLYRVVSLREVMGNRITHVRWHATIEGANEYVAWVNDGRGKVIDFAKYVRVEEEK